MNMILKHYIKAAALSVLCLCGVPLLVFSKPSASNAASDEGLTSLQLREKADEKYYKEKYPEALDLYIQAMEKAAVEGDDNNYAACTGYIGNIYDTFGDDNSCIYYYLKGYESARRTGCVSLQSNFLTNLVTAYTRMGNVGQARHYYRLLEQTPNKLDLDDYHYYLLYEKARILTAEHHYDEAVAVHRQAFDYAAKHRMKPICQLFQMSEIGNLYVRDGQPEKAVAMGDSCMALAHRLNSDELLVNAYKMKTDAYTQLQVTDSARHYRELYFSLNDSVYNIKKFYKARYKLSEYENREHLAEVSTLNERLLMQVYVITGIAAFLLMILVFTYIIYKKNRHLNVAKRLLIERNKEMEATDRQNRVLLEEYLKRLENVEKQADPVRGERTETEGTAEPRGNIPALSDDDEKKLLAKINAAMNDTDTISNPDFSLLMLADMVGSNTHYVSHVINSTYGKNFKTLLNERRIREACHKLADREQCRNYTMQVVYESVGYTNATSFIRAFKKVYGMTPSEYQRLTFDGTGGSDE